MTSGGRGQAGPASPGKASWSLGAAISHESGSKPGGFLTAAAVLCHLIEGGLQPGGPAIARPILKLETRGLGSPWACPVTSASRDGDACAPGTWPGPLRRFWGLTCLASSDLCQASVTAAKAGANLFFSGDVRCTKSFLAIRSSGQSPTAVQPPAPTWSSWQPARCDDACWEHRLFVILGPAVGLVGVLVAAQAMAVCLREPWAGGTPGRRVPHSPPCAQG